MDLRHQLQTTLSGSYTLERELGGGGVPRVFVAQELRPKQQVMVKVVSPELAQGISVEPFEREIQTPRIAMLPGSRMWSDASSPPRL